MTLAANLAALARRVVGISANNLVALDGSAKLPAVDGSLLTGLALGGIKGVRLITASGSVTPSAGVTKWLYFIVDGGYNGGESGQGAQYKAGGGGSGGKGSIGLVSVDAAIAYNVIIGAGNGGATSVLVGGVTKTSTNGILNVPAANPDSPPMAFNSSAVSWAMSGSGGPGPFGFGNGGYVAVAGGATGGANGNPGTGYGAGGGGGVSGSQNGNLAGGGGSPGCLLILEY
jgi:hypothetical protein